MLLVCAARFVFTHEFLYWWVCGCVFDVVVRLCVKFVVCLVISCYCLVNVCCGCQMLVALV